MTHFKRFHLGFIFLGLVLASSFVLEITGCQSKDHRAAGASAGKSFYQCSMHPTIVSDKPDNCPICGMRLTRVDQAYSKKVVPSKRKLLYYRNPMRADITSPKPTKDEMGMDYIAVYEGDDEGGGSIQIPGHADVVISPERQQLIGVQTSFVEEKNLTTTINAVGRVAHDPDLYNVLAEYRGAVESLERVKHSAIPEIREQGESLVKATTLKLRLMGFSDVQMQESLKSKNNSNLLLPSDKAWVYADVYEYESGLIQTGQKALISSPALPRLRFEGTVKVIDSVLNSMSRTLRVRIEVDNPDKALKPEMFVDVTIEASLGKKLAIPEEALFDTGTNQIVFVDKGEGHIEPRQVRVGYEASGYYELLEGLTKGEKIITYANFLIDSESRLRAAVQGMGVMKKETKEPVSEMPVPKDKPND